MERYVVERKVRRQWSSNAAEILFVWLLLLLGDGLVPRLSCLFLAVKMRQVGRREKCELAWNRHLIGTSLNFSPDRSY
jgi:hypothetical protein